MGSAMSAVDINDAGSEGVAWVPGRTFIMGSERYPVEAPAHFVYVVGFWIAATPVTNPPQPLCSSRSS